MTWTSFGFKARDVVRPEPDNRNPAPFVAASVGGRIAPAHLTKTYRPHLRVGSGEYLGIAFCGDGSGEPVRPGVCVNAEVKFVYAPDVDYTPLIVGSQFQILEGARIVGIGAVVELVP